MKYTTFPEYESIGIAGCELKTQEGFLSGEGNLR